MGRMVPDHVIEEIRSRTDIVDLIGSRITLKRAGPTYKALCPFHKEKTPSFSVNPSRQRYHCFGCGQDGDVFTFLMQHEGMTFMDAVKALGERAGIAIELEEEDGRSRERRDMLAIYGEVADFYRRCLTQMRSAEPARQYLAQRALTGEVVERFGIGYAPPRWDALLQWARKHGRTPEQMVAAGLVKHADKPGARRTVYDRFRDRLMFPIRDVQGRVVAFSGRILTPNDRAAKYVNSPETPIFQKSRILYALDVARKAIVGHPRREALVCEGQIDVIRCHAAGFETAVASQGTAFTREHVQLLKHYADSAVLLFDPDSAGRKAAVKTAEHFLEEGIAVRIARLPEGEDPDTFIQRAGADGFAEVIEKAESVMHFQAGLLRAGEATPDGLDATSRMADGMLRTIRAGTNPIQRARMLQEAAEELNVPVGALEEQLEFLNRRAERREKKDARPGQPPHAAFHHDSPSAGRRSQPHTVGGSAPYTPPLPDAAAPAPWGAEPDDDDMEFLPHLEGYTPVRPPYGQAPAADARAAAPAQVISPEERTLCEVLVHHEADRALADLITRYLPLRLIRHPACRTIIGAAVEASITGDDALARLQTSEAPDVARLMGIIATTPSRTEGREYSPIDGLRDCILTLWRHHLSAERKALTPAPGDADNPDAAARRIQIAYDLKHLRSWKEGIHTIEVELATHDRDV